MAYKRISPQPVVEGGTGAITLTNHGALIGAGTSAITQLTVGTNGQVLLGSTAADPSFANLTTSAGSLTYTTGASSLNIDVKNWTVNSIWTPTLTFGGGSTGITYSLQEGYYSRVGNIVTLYIVLVFTNKGSSTGAVSIAGPGTSPFNATPLAIRFTQLTYTGQVVAVANGTSFFVESAASSGSVTTLTDTAFANNTFIEISGSYLI